MKRADPMETAATRPSSGASFSGSWWCVGLFALVLLAWGGVNELSLLLDGSRTDPRPYVLLNLLLSALAVLLALMMLLSQIRASGDERTGAPGDDESRAQAEREIGLLHDRIHALRDMH